MRGEGVFNWLIPIILKPFVTRPFFLIGILLLTGTLMAALVDEVTSILFICVIMLKVLDGSGISGKPALPFIMFLVYTTNIGSSALFIGNPIGVLIVFGADLTVLDFLRWRSPIAIVCSLITSLIAVIYLKRTTELR